LSVHVVHIDTTLFQRIRNIFSSLFPSVISFSVIFLFITHSKAEMLCNLLNDFLVMLESTQIDSSSRKKCWFIAWW